jgi:Rnl2 family RNA ligase
MIKFDKYPSTDNHYAEKTVNYWLNKEPELNNIEYILQEKIDGANFQIYITADEIRVGKRSSLLGEESNFNDWQETLKKYDEHINILQKFCNTEDCQLTLYGEIYGAGIQNRIHYSKEKHIAIYDLKIDSVWQSVAAMNVLFCDLGINGWLTPTITCVTGIDAARNFEVEGIKTELNHYPEYGSNKMIEGVVIKPLHKVYTGVHDSPFKLKLKSKAFNDKSKVKIPKGDDRSDLAKELTVVFNGYINENRVLDYISKEGEPESKRDIGNYIKGIGEDAKEDFMKDHGELFDKVDDKEKKGIFKATGSLVMPHLQKYL